MHVWMGWSYRMGRRMAAPYASEAQETREERAKDYHALDLVRVREEVGVRADVQAVLVAVGLVLAAAAKGRGRVLVARRARDRDRAATARRRRSRCRDANGNASGRGGDARGARETRRAARDGVAVVGRTTARAGAVISIVSLAKVRRGLCARGDPTRASPR